MFDQISITTFVRILYNAYLYSCIALIGCSYLGYWFINQLEESLKQSQQTH